MTRALSADTIPTTHPVQVGIEHTGDATNAFDAISYEKGASWIKLMDTYVSREILTAGLSSYVNKFAFKNTVLEDLVTCLEEEFVKKNAGKHLG